MIPVEIPSLLKFLEGCSYQPKLQEETQQIYTVLPIQGQDFPLFLRIFDQSQLLQLLVFLPCQIKPGVEGDLARLLHLINKELDIPGFGMDEQAAVVFYRFMLPIPGKSIDAILLRHFLKSLTLICESIAPAAISVAAGLATFEEIIRQAQGSPSHG